MGGAQKSERMDDITAERTSTFLYLQCFLSHLSCLSCEADVSRRDRC